MKIYFNGYFRYILKHVYCVKTLNEIKNCFKNLNKKTMDSQEIRKIAHKIM